MTDEFRVVCQIDKDTGRVIDRFESRLYVRRSFPGIKNVNTNVKSCLDKKSKTSLGYIWKYEDEILNMSCEEIVEQAKPRTRAIPIIDGKKRCTKCGNNIALTEFGNNAIGGFKSH